MGRPSKLDEKQKAEILRRLANGEKSIDLAREFKMSRGRFSVLFSKQVEPVLELANRLADVEREYDALPVSKQCSVRSLADQLKGIQNNLAQAANSTSKVSNHLAGVAAQMAKAVTSDSQPEDLRPIVAMIEGANRAGSMGVTLLTANKGTTEAKTTLEDLILASYK